MNTCANNSKFKTKYFYLKFIKLNNFEDFSLELKEKY